jgi:hypothetical protein
VITHGGGATFNFRTTKAPFSKSRLAYTGQCFMYVDGHAIHFSKSKTRVA